jgi:hypothetical protein
MLGYFMMKYGVNDVAFPAVALWKGIWIGSAFYLAATAILSCVFYCIYQDAEKVIHATRWVHNLRCRSIRTPKKVCPSRFLSTFMFSFDLMVMVGVMWGGNTPLLILISMALVVFLTSIEVVDYHLWMVKLCLKWAISTGWIMLIFISTQMDPVLATIYTIGVLRDNGVGIDKWKVASIFSVAYVFSTSYTIAWFLVLRRIILELFHFLCSFFG